MPSPVVADWMSPDAGPAALRAMLSVGVDAGLLRELDQAFAHFLMDQVPAAAPLGVTLAALCSVQLGHGHTCLVLSDLAADPAGTLGLGAADLRRAELRSLIDGLHAHSADMLIKALDGSGLVCDGRTPGPLVRHGPRLYLRRYWDAERRVQAGLVQRLAPGKHIVDAGRTRAWLDALFPDSGAGGTDWQKIACAGALDFGFSVITGGPGTGKTTTVVKLLALLQGLELERPDSDGQGLNIRLAAPTGKAAARLNASISGALGHLREISPDFMQAAWSQVPARVTTLHRLLGSRPGTRRFRHDSSHRLPVDVLVIDEASMMDIEMIDAVLAALPDHARLILLGDKDQLASVEAGAVLGEICRRAAGGHYTPQRCMRLTDLSGQTIASDWQDASAGLLDQAVVMLRHSYRFDAGSGIGRLASAVNRGDPQALSEALSAGDEDLGFLNLTNVADPQFDRLVCTGALPKDDVGGTGLGYADYLTLMHDARPAAGAGQAAIDEWAQQVLHAHGRFQVLCALREGPWGTSGLNQRIEAGLRQAGLIHTEHLWYPGRPVLVVRNRYDLGLANGDIGLALDTPDPSDPAHSVIRVAFPRGDGQPGLRWVLPSRLSETVTVFALTVHKSQGSEFDRVVLVLPDRGNPVLTRELLYTGMTRARHDLVLAGVNLPSVFSEAVRVRVRRASGLFAD
ncbi:MAG: exodeoxyribonuclease V subunit alpha [Alcaligenaceae bacterium]|nr:exodeoxyribonuclease V subunit alpha [Alcaligenaceae bacterium]